jgi:polysaccharide export outer membrane protein
VRVLAAALVAAGCSSASSPGAPTGPHALPGSTADAGVELMSSVDLSRLAALARERQSSGDVDAAYRIGPDDLLDIRIPDLVGAEPRQAAAESGTGGVGRATVAGAPTFHEGERVDDLGEISVAHVGVIHAAGLTAAELEAEIARRLIASGILRRPQVAVQIAEYRSRVVAVVGNVERPGTYPLTRPGATVADMIWAAGGPGKEAGRVVQFSPASASAPRAAAGSLAGGSRQRAGEAEGLTGENRLAASPATQSDADPGGLATRGQPIRIDLQALLRAADSGTASLNPQVRPGDVINVSSAGSVLVEGWVDKPGSYPVTPGLTLSGALVAAGGHVYAADLETVTVRRMLGPGEQRLIPVDLVAVSEGRATDIPILDGDVVSVPMHSGKAVPYGLWKLGREVIHVGASVPIF